MSSVQERERHEVSLAATSCCRTLTVLGSQPAGNDIITLAPIRLGQSYGCIAAGKRATKVSASSFSRSSRVYGFASGHGRGFIPSITGPQLVKRVCVQCLKVDPLPHGRREPPLRIPLKGGNLGLPMLDRRTLRSRLDLQKMDHYQVQKNSRPSAVRTVPRPRFPRRHSSSRRHSPALRARGGRANRPDSPTKPEHHARRDHPA